MTTLEFARATCFILIAALWAVGVLRRKVLSSVPGARTDAG
ncbi:hypothetical protein ACN28S_50925 [Cystobacter fuscus]